ncbi:MAG: hypothetical protein LBT01_00230 [Spirochaetaceae bacterium]|jgi:hypothetical protein|nr:hypothetical protein [Spirochaetaceae bacterium]
MNGNCIFIDFENVQKINDELLSPETRLFILVGLTQDDKAFAFAKKLFGKVSSIELIKVPGRGPNALDFFITFYLGKHIEDIKTGKIIIHSNDTGYDPLIKHLSDKGIFIERRTFQDTKKTAKPTEPKARRTRTPLPPPVPPVQQTASAPPPHLAPPQKNLSQNIPVADDESYMRIFGYLTEQTAREKAKRPRKEKTLINQLYSHFAQSIEEEKIRESVNRLIAEKHIELSNNKITYTI